MVISVRFKVVSSTSSLNVRPNSPSFKSKLKLDKVGVAKLSCEISTCRACWSDIPIPGLPYKSKKEESVIDKNEAFLVSKSGASNLTAEKSNSVMFTVIKLEFSVDIAPSVNV